MLKALYRYLTTAALPTPQMESRSLRGGKGTPTNPRSHHGKVEKHLPDQFRQRRWQADRTGEFLLKENTLPSLTGL